MSIPNKAVEAAYERVHLHLDLADFPADEVKDALRVALEAAAPHLMAEFEKQRKYAVLDATSELGSDNPDERRWKATK